MRAAALLRDQRLDRRACGMAFEPAGLEIEFQRAQLLVGSELRIADRRLQHAKGLVIDPQRHREGLSVLAAMRERESRGIAEAVRSSMEDSATKAKASTVRAPTPGTS